MTSLLATWTEPTSTGGCWPLYFFGKTAYDNCVNRFNIAQIQSVPQNAAAAGYPPNVVAAAQAAADQQSRQVPTDTQSIDTLYNLPSSPFIPSIAPGTSPFDPSTWPTWAWIALGLGGAVVAWKVLK